MTSIATEDELLAAFLPIALYWVYAGFMDLVPQRYRLYSQQQEKKLNRDYLSKSLVIKNVLRANALQISITLLVFYLRGAEKKPTQPPLWTQAVQVLVGMLMMDTWIYFMYRLLHTRYLYKHVHAVHHDLVVPCAVGTLYQHPVEGLLVNTAAGAVVYLVTGMTPRTIAFFISLATIKNVNDHCGYHLPWSPFRVFGDGVRLHDFHHSNQVTKGTLGSPSSAFGTRLWAPIRIRILTTIA